MQNELWSKVNKTAKCWLWTGTTTNNGYGVITRNNKSEAVHRFVYKLLVGPIPRGLTLDHNCNVSNCVNPAHLEPMTQRENILKSNNMAARNANKKLCPQGHLLVARKDRPDWRYCPTCRKAQRRERYLSSKV